MEATESHSSWWVRILVLALLALTLLSEERGVEQLAAWSSRASAASLDWLQGGGATAAADAMFAREVSARADAAIRRVSAQLQLSAEHLSRGTVGRGDKAPFWRLLERAAVIRRRGAGHITVLNVGGSSSTGADLERLDEIFSAVFARALEDVLGVPVVILNAAVGATGSDYYAVCVSQHLSPAVDIVLTENAVNDATLIGDGLEPATIVQQLILSVRALAPHAILVYSGLIAAFSCWTGEDLPRVLSVYELYNVSVVSTRNLVFGPPSTWSDGAACPALQPPFTYEAMFKGKNHASSTGHAYLALLILNVFAEHFRAAVGPSSTAVQEIRPLFDASPYSGQPFNCKSTLSPRFGAPLIPVPTPGCEAVWAASGEPELVGSGCGGFEASQLWGESVSATPVTSEVEDFPLVENWDLSSASFFAPDKPGTVRQDRKYNWDSRGEGAAITFLVRVGAVGTLAVGYLAGDEFYGAATFYVSNAAGEAYSAEITDHVKSSRHTRAVILFRGLAAGWWRLRVEPHARFGICAIATA